MISVVQQQCSHWNATFSASHDPNTPTNKQFVFNDLVLERLTRIQKSVEAIEEWYDIWKVAVAEACREPACPMGKKCDGNCR
jgi:beta-xylosidase